MYEQSQYTSPKSKICSHQKSRYLLEDPQHNKFKKIALTGSSCITQLTFFKVLYALPKTKYLSKVIIHRCS